MKINTNEILKYATIVGSVLITVKAVSELTKAKDLKSGGWDAVGALVGISAFSYAMTAPKVSFMPQTAQ